MPSLIPLASALTGALIGGLLTFWRERSHERRQVVKEKSYLAAIVGRELDDVVDICVALSEDDGTDEDGAPAGGNGQYWTPTVNPPKFDPLAIQVDWKSLPNDLMQELLCLPMRLRQVQRANSDAWDDNELPEYYSGFWARQRNYAQLGLEVLALAKRLRTEAKLPLREHAGTTQLPEKRLSERIRELDKEKAARDAKIAAAAPAENW